MKASELSEHLQRHTEQVAQYLLPHGKREGKYWCVGSIQGEAGNSLKITLTKSNKGLWADFATNERGDLLDLWSAVKQLSLPNAMKDAMNWLGIKPTGMKAVQPMNFSRPKDVTLNPVTGAPQRYLTEHRRLTPETLKAFQVGEKKGLMVFPYWRDKVLVNIKHMSTERMDGKRRIRTWPNAEPCLFGWQALPKGSREVTLTEGEIDAMTLWQQGIPALSLPFGGGSGKKQAWIEHEYERLSHFDTIYLCLDNDEPGKQALITIIDRLGRHRCHVVNLPHKDANDCLQAGFTSEDFKQHFNKAKTIDPSQLKASGCFARGVHNLVQNEFDEPDGIPSPWGQNKALYFRNSELSLWTGINGHGKSQMLGQLALHCIRQGQRVCIASLELPPERLLHRIVRQASGLRSPSKGYIDAIFEWMGQELWLFDVTGKTKTQLIMDVFEYARRRYGIQVFIIDSLMKCGLNEESFQEQKDFVEQLCDFKNQFPVHIHLVAHPRKGADEYKMPNKFDVKGTGTITDLADNCFTVWRNKLKEHEICRAEIEHRPPKPDIVNRADALLSCDKQRYGEWEGEIPLNFNKDAFQFLPLNQKRPMRFVEYSSTNQERDTHENQ